MRACEPTALAAGLKRALRDEFQPGTAQGCHSGNHVYKTEMSALRMSFTGDARR